MEKLKTGLSVEVDGVDVIYGQIPSGLIEGWEGIVYYFQTSDAEKHVEVVTKVIEQLQSQSYDHGSEWRRTEIDDVVWNDYCQITLVSFRVRDSW